MVMTVSISMSLTYQQHKDSRQVCELLLSAYNADPMFQHLFHQPKFNFVTSLQTLFREEIALHLSHQQPIIGATEGDELWGVACVFDPEYRLTGERSWSWRMRMLSSSGIASTSRYLEKELRLSQALAGHHCHYMSLLAVHPDRVCQGVGDTLLAGLDSLVAEHPSSVGSTILVSNEECTAWLQRHGYIESRKLLFSGYSGALLFKAR